MTLALLALLLTVQSSSPCPNLASCRALALEAQQRQDYEAFHDLAWATYRKAPNDPAVMLLLARAQSLSGRPGDALVMLERVAAAGIPTGAATGEDFARVRALPRWPSVAAKFSAEPPPAKDPASSFAKATQDKSSSAKAGEDKPSSAKTEGKPSSVNATADKSPSAKAGEDKPSSAKAKASEDRSSSAKAGEDKPSSPKATEDKSSSAKAAGDKPSAKDPPASAPLRFTTVLTPSALVYDAVSKRFIVADRRARRIAVIDKTTGQVSTLVGAQGDLGEIGGITIDPRQGDLWAVSSDEGGAQQLHRIQLISGRVLRSVPLSGIKGQVVALAFVPETGLIMADDTGRIARVRAEGRGEALGELEYVPRALAADSRGRLYVTAGGPRLARFTVGTALRRADLVDLAPGTPVDAPFTVAEGLLHFIVPVDGAFEVRSMRIR